MKHLSTLVIISFFVFSIQAQDFSLRGKLASAEDSTAMIGATLQLVSIKDTTKRYYGVSDIEGYFKLEKLQKSFYKLKVTSVGFMPFSNFVNVSSSDTNVGTLLMNPDTLMLKDVNISGQIIPVKQRGDTTEYNALAFKPSDQLNS